MRNTLFLAFVIGLTSAACSMRGQPKEGASAEEIYNVSMCHTCHGDFRNGTDVAPSLVGLASSWNRDDLAEFLKNPDALLSTDERLKALDGMFRKEMPTYDNLSLTQRTVLAEWLLQQP